MASMETSEPVLVGYAVRSAPRVLDEFPELRRRHMEAIADMIEYRAAKAGLRRVGNIEVAREYHGRYIKVVRYGYEDVYDEMECEPEKADFAVIMAEALCAPR